MSDAGSDEQKSPDTRGRLLEFTVNGETCYGLKWNDVQAENRREVDYVWQHPDTKEIQCLLVNCALRIGRHLELVSIDSKGRMLTNCETDWRHAKTVWEGGSKDGNGSVRFCPLETQPEWGPYAAQVLKRLIREYGAGACQCYVPTATPPATSGLVPTGVDRVEQRIADLITAVQQAGSPKVGTSAPDSAAVRVQRENLRLRALAALTLEDAAKHLISAFPDLDTNELHAGMMHARGVPWSEMARQSGRSKSTVSGYVARFYKVTDWPRNNRRMGMGRKLPLDAARDGNVA